ncbi:MULTISPECIES: hormogonium polysaccharide secretion pseudopilin HpsB [unclassified Microcoleus]|uniref:hormogonium polysaccharide secretion pseudopilin HpsB n=1 Tax=unclassified Microcoleus TaxID=2642155 RepID=UPI002FD0C3BF
MTKRQQQQNLSQSPDGGYTIIESLVAMIVVSVLMIAIAPVMAYSVATRVQARRIELASQAATAYINALRVGAIKPPTNPQPTIGFPARDTTVSPALPPAPASTNPQSNLYCVDFDETTQGCAGSKDFFVQGVWRNPANTTNDPTPTGYELTVRVYRADGFTGATMTTVQQSVANSALGNPQAPLVVMKTQIPPTTQGTASAHQSLCSQLNPNGANTSACR